MLKATKDAVVALALVGWYLMVPSVLKAQSALSAATNAVPVPIDMPVQEQRFCAEFPDFLQSVIQTFAPAPAPSPESTNPLKNDLQSEQQKTASMNRVVQQGFLPLLKALGWGNLVQELIGEDREEPQMAFHGLEDMKGSVEHWTGTLDSVVVINDRFGTVPAHKDYATAVKLPCGVVFGISRATAERLQQRLDEATGDPLDTPWPLAMTREGNALLDIADEDGSVQKSFGTMEIGQPLEFTGTLYIFPEPDRSFVVEFSRVTPRKRQ